MKKVIVYFHGYGSSPNSDKVKRLRQEKDWEVYAFPINIDPTIAFSQLTLYIDMVLAEEPIEEDFEMVFVGTSLGAWWASRISRLYKCNAVLINPCVDPAMSLAKYDVPDEIRSKYYLLSPYFAHKYFFAENDEVIPNETFRHYLFEAGYDITVTPNATHRFDGEAFEGVIDYLDMHFARKELSIEMSNEFDITEKQRVDD